MQYFNYLKNIMKNIPCYETWDSMPDTLLLFFFISSSIPASYWGYILKDLFPLYIDAFNKAGMTEIGLLVSLIMLILIIKTLVFSCISKRCGELIYLRWFK